MVGVQKTKALQVGLQYFISTKITYWNWNYKYIEFKFIKHFGKV